MILKAAEGKIIKEVKRSDGLWQGFYWSFPSLKWLVGVLEVRTRYLIWQIYGWLMNTLHQREKRTKNIKWKMIKSESLETFLFNIFTLSFIPVDRREKWSSAVLIIEWNTVCIGFLSWSASQCFSCSSSAVCHQQCNASGKHWQVVQYWARATTCPAAPQQLLCRRVNHVFELVQRDIF